MQNKQITKLCVTSKAETDIISTIHIHKVQQENNISVML